MSQSKAELVAPVGIFTASGINVTGVVTASSFEGDGSQLQGVGIGTTGSINSSGIITASAFYGSGIGLTGITLLGPTNNYETTGIITAGAFYGDGIGITNIGGPLSPISYSPGIGQTNVGVSTNIVITFNKPIAAAAATSGIATITLRTDAADGTIVESFDIADSAQLSISGGVLTITPSAAMAGFTTHFLVIPAGTLQDTIDTSDNVGITTYSFTTEVFDTQLFMWGRNADGQLGQNNLTQYSSPTQIPGTQWGIVTEENYRSTHGKKTDGTLWSWGYNVYGQLGQNNTVRYSSPTQIPGTQWSLVTEGSGTTQATKTDGTLWAWGQNAYGELGQNNTTNYSSPIQIPGTQWSKVVSGYQTYSVFGIKTDGTLWSCGRNNYGQLGQNDAVTRSSPVQVPGTQWSNFNGGRGTINAVKTDGTLWVWGRNNYGQLGQNDRTDRSSPIQIPGTQWSKVIAGLDYAGGIKTDGTLWVWGRNDYSTLAGQLGLNDLVPRSSPTQLPGTQWSSASFAYWGSQAIKTDRTLWSWGYNPYGQTGNNTQGVSWSSPIQIPGTQWYALGEASYSTNALKLAS